MQQLASLCYLTGARNGLVLGQKRILFASSSVANFASRDPKRMSNRKFIETELKENPEFFKAFPHL